MRTKSTSLVGVVVPGISNPFFAELVEALERALRPYGLEVILGDSSGGVQEETSRIETMVDRKVDGLIMVPTHHDASVAALRAATGLVPIVQVDRYIDRLASDYVGVDNAAGVRSALDHLAQQGCRKVVFVSDSGSTSSGRSRLHAFQAGVKQIQGLEAAKPFLGTFSLDFGREVVEALVKRGRLPDAVVCGADIVALGVLQALRLHHVSVPDRVKVTGFDGILFGELSDPALTTLRQPVSWIAQEAALLLDARLRGDDSPPRRLEGAPLLVVRRSSSGAVTDT
jgi:LacI family transcriptional regulator